MIHNRNLFRKRKEIGWQSILLIEFLLIDDEPARKDNERKFWLSLGLKSKLWIINKRTS